MLDSIIKLVIGDLEEKREYKEFMKRVDALPKEYRFSFKKIRHYMYSVGSPAGDMTIFTNLTMFANLVDLFEASVQEGKSVLDVIGNDVGKFSDELMCASGSSETPGKKLVREIREKFGKEENRNV